MRRKFLEVLWHGGGSDVVCIHTYVPRFCILCTKYEQEYGQISHSMRVHITLFAVTIHAVRSILR